jgi:hypothetical protein
MIQFLRRGVHGRLARISGEWADRTEIEMDEPILPNNAQLPQPNARLIAYYLPQFHPIAENDLWWGKGFTEWTNVARAKPLFRGHFQPNVPADLGFYDLRVPETRQAQAELARSCGIEAFLYWHYWFAGERLLERPFREVLESGKPDFPFCLGWANETWSGIWHGARGRILKEQTYPGDDDHRRHFDLLLGAFNDRRYVLVEGKPLLGIYQPTQLPDARRAIELWRALAAKAGLAGLYVVGIASPTGWTNCKPGDMGLDAVTTAMVHGMQTRRPALKRHWITYALRGYPKVSGAIGRLMKAPRSVYDFEAAVAGYKRPAGLEGTWHPSVMPNWDNTPRSGRRGTVLRGSTPELFRNHIKQVLQMVSDEPPEKRIIFIKSWNEWAEGNYLEPDLRWGRQYTDVIREEVLR